MDQYMHWKNYNYNPYHKDIKDKNKQINKEKKEKSSLS